MKHILNTVPVKGIIIKKTVLRILKFERKHQTKQILCNNKRWLQSITNGNPQSPLLQDVQKLLQQYTHVVYRKTLVNIFCCACATSLKDRVIEMSVNECVCAWDSWKKGGIKHSLSYQNKWTCTFYRNHRAYRLVNIAWGGFCMSFLGNVEVIK